ncbi:LAMI_0A00606g1_1 [Lachancea mirantina]|uniref:LAMI_0A00606g1_1 n=1 Tax=Lachancea mirantina TaxID=1230905 RepID=A0A1G4ILA9_9SACH|nr:LAMI_0A00606g1_1 [Lachancea mirantina]
MLVPPANFGVVEEGIYRCSKIETLNLSFIETLNLRTVIFVGGQEPSKFFKEYFERCCISWSLIKVTDMSSALAPPHRANVNPAAEKMSKSAESGKSEMEIYELTDNDDLMLIKSSSQNKIFEVLLDKRNYNTIVVDKSSIVVGILRKILKWDISSVVNEYRLFTGKNSNYMAETFLELINIRLIQDMGDMWTKKRDSLNGNFFGGTSNSDNSASSWEIVNESDLSSSPNLPSHLSKILQEAEAECTAKNGEASVSVSPMARTHSDLGVFANHYRLAFNKSERADYAFYKANRHNMVTLSLPKESHLPSWFTFQRDLWESENAAEEHSFYKESIFQI